MRFKENQIQNLDEYLNHQSDLSILKFITCGSVDDGKSTLIGRMLFEAQTLFEDQIKLLKNESIKSGTQGISFDYAMLLDGLEAEREQGITIDVAYRYFSTKNRKFIVGDTPGHEQYTRNMVTGASNADVALILVDARKGVLTQTRRHSIICSALGIKNIVLAVNKMDLVDYSSKIFKEIEIDYFDFVHKLNFSTITPIPISALTGVNVVKRSIEMDWYNGPTLLSYLESVDVHTELTSKSFCMPVQMVNRPNSEFRGFCGLIETGKLYPKQKIRVLPSNEIAHVKEIILFKNSLSHAEAGQSVTVTLDKEIDVSRGDVLVDSFSPLEVSDQFETNIVWMGNENGYVGRSYVMKLGTLNVNCQITVIKHKYNINNLEKLPSRKLELNDFSSVVLKTDCQIPFEIYKNSSALGGFILIDRFNNQTIAAGMINFSIRRAKNIHLHKLDINKSAREIMNGHKSKVIWFTGLSGSGKSTIANALEKKLYLEGIRTYILDGDNIRLGLNNDLGFTDEDRIENIRRISEVSKLMVDAGIVVITAFISPFKAERLMARKMFNEGEFIEVFVDVPLQVAEARDPKGLYKKARRGELPNFTGIDSKYEIPEKPEIRISTVNMSVNDIVDSIIKKIDL